ncbi:hypothetical protein CEW92_03460 [Bacillaceae bacterium SAS-127]|nr:hypothetical protein CEW92_03460 [Bacillaceae bacterium SAS-127]
MFGEGYQIQHKESGKFVYWAQPVPIDRIMLSVENKNDHCMHVSEMHEEFELIKVHNAPRAIKLR